jgi:molybdate transport system substrate-binding protein
MKARHVLFLLVVSVLAMANVAVAEERRAPAEPVGITVFAAASLTNAFTEIARLFETQHPGQKVTLNFGGSQQLAAQIIEAAPAHVFASANPEQMKRVLDAGFVRGLPHMFASNRLVIAVEPGNPKKITTLSDLSRAGLIVVLASEEVPAGRYAREALRKAGTALTPASLETDVRSVLSKVALGEADAGIVYRSDIVAASGAVAMVEIPPAQDVIAYYPLAVLTRDAESNAPAAFVAFVLSKPGRAILARFGFGAP